MNLFVAADLTALPSPYATLAAGVLPPPKFTLHSSHAPHAAAVAPLEGVSLGLITSGQEGQAVIASLSAVESHFLISTAPGLGVYSEDHAPLRVAIEYLTALEGDFWVKLRGAGLTYSYFLRASTDSQLVSFGLFKCADMIGAYTAAKQIIVDYASGKSSISEVDLDGAKSTVTYSIISSTSTRLSAAASAWESSYEGKGVDYGKWLLTQVGAVSIADVLHAVKKYIVPLFDASANLAAVCPTNKLDAGAHGLEAALGISVRKLQEENLYSAFDTAAETAAAVTTTTVPAPVPASVPVVKPGGGAFSFAKQFKCECPKCGPADTNGV